MKAEIRWETVTLPTYEPAAPEKAPLFLERRTYQGSAGKVYPFPVTEKLSDEKEPKAYRAIILENDYLYVMLLPELGGRIHRALDKTNGYDFVYYNHVVKPALVGLAGPWISGGIEFNWPQHHRPSTFLPVDAALRENDDGSVTAFVGETDRMYGTRGMAAITLYPDKAYIEVKGQLYNPTDLPQTFLWWANPAVAVNDSTFSVFPPDVNAVYDHGKRDVSTFPIATGEYYKCDYSAGVDISRYRNIPVPTSYMAARSDFDFIGNFDESRGAGLLHIADHHVSPGKKQWTWGCGDFGRMWDKNLTDGDGPYIELMTGVFTDNQPDFTWLKPHEEKTFTQYFLPYKTVGRVSNATRDAVIGVEGDTLRVYATAVYKDAVIRVEAGGREIYSKTVTLTPQACFCERVGGLRDFCVSVRDAGGETLCEYREYRPERRPIPKPAKPLERPERLRSTEELLLAGRHLEQYRHATFSPADYYREGLRRDGTDLRLNNAYGLLLLRGGRLRESVAYFERAIQKQTWRNPNPYEGECYYNLGVARALLGEEEKAYDAFYKATWSAETQPQGFYHLACLCARRGEYKKALEMAERSLVCGAHNTAARTLKAMLLRCLGRDDRAFLRESHALDPLAPGLLYLLGKPLGRADNYLRAALEQMRFGRYDAAAELLDACPQPCTLAEYYKGYAAYRAGQTDRARAHYEKAETMPGEYVFPNTLEEMLILENAILVLGSAPMASLYLGNLLYDKGWHERAAQCWQSAAAQKPSLAMAHRNLSIALYNHAHKPKEALAEIIKAQELEPDYSRFLLERDQLSARAGVPARERLAVLERSRDLLAERDALYLAYITLLNAAGRAGEALRCLETHRFHPWEGGEGKVAAQYKAALFALAERAAADGQYEKAAALCEKTLRYPENLGEGKLENAPDNEAYYRIGLCLRARGDEEGARAYFRRACAGSCVPAPVRYYNDVPSDYIYYQGLAFLALGERACARKSFHQLIAFGERYLGEPVEDDFFAVSVPEFEIYREDAQKQNDDSCRLLIELGKKGLNQCKEEEDRV